MPIVSVPLQNRWIKKTEGSGITLLNLQNIQMKAHTQQWLLIIMHSSRPKEALQKRQIKDLKHTTK